MIKYAIRHKATGLLMPRAKKDAGYSHWKPGAPEVKNDPDWRKNQVKDGMGNAIPGSLRLFDTEKQANRSITEWAKGERERIINTTGFLEEEVVVTTPRHVSPARNRSEMEVVRFELTESRIFSPW